MMSNRQPITPERAQKASARIPHLSRTALVGLLAAGVLARAAGGGGGGANDGGGGFINRIGARTIFNKGVRS